MRVRSALLILSLIAPTAAAQDDPVRLHITRAGVRRVLLQLQPTELLSRADGAAEGARSLANLLASDLVYSGWVKLKEPLPVGLRFPRYTPEAAKGKPDEIAEYSLFLSLDGARSQKMVWLARLVVPSSNTVVLAKRYDLDLQDARRSVHHLADALIAEMTGEVGIAQTRIVFSRGSGERREIHIVDFDGENARRLTRNGSLNLLPRWSPDGTSLCYTSYWRGRQQLLVLEGQSGASRKIAEYDGLNLGAAWSPDGRELVATLSRDGDPEIYRLRPDGAIAQRLSFEPSIEASPAFDPTGRQIVYTSDRTGVPQIYVMDREGMHPRRLTYEGSYNDSASWSPRGDRIAYVSRREGRFQIFTIEPDGSNLQEVTTSADGNNEDPSWAPDGRHLVVSSDRSGKQRLWVLDVEGGTARPLTDGGGEDTTPHWSGAPQSRAAAPGR
jgi:TolB protein